MSEIQMRQVRNTVVRREYAGEVKSSPFGSPYAYNGEIESGEATEGSNEVREVHAMQNSVMETSSRNAVSKSCDCPCISSDVP